MKMFYENLYCLQKFMNMIKNHSRLIKKQKNLIRFECLIFYKNTSEIVGTQNTDHHFFGVIIFSYPSGCQGV